MNFWVAPDPTRAMPGQASHALGSFGTAGDPSEPERVFGRLLLPRPSTEIKRADPVSGQQGSFEKTCLRTSFSLYAAGLNGG